MVWLLCVVVCCDVLWVNDLFACVIVDCLFVVFGCGDLGGSWSLWVSCGLLV